MIDKTNKDYVLALETIIRYTNKCSNNNCDKCLLQEECEALIEAALIFKDKIKYKKVNG